MPPILAVDDLSVSFRSKAGTTPILHNLTLSLGPGESLGIVGESGSGKSLLLRSIAHVLPPGAEISGGAMSFDGADMTRPTRRQLHRFRGRELGMVLQDPMVALNPVMTVEAQLLEAIGVTDHGTSKAKLARASELLDQVEVRNPERVLRAYPHQLSGGIAQRTVIAMAIASRPRVLLADEPTTALDVTIQAQILRLLSSLQEQLNMTLILVSHDLAVVAESCEQVAVMYAGRVVETGPAGALFSSPQHPYTRGLLASIPPGPGSGQAARLLNSIPGAPPLFGSLPSGCAFRPRCPLAIADCASEVPALRDIGGGRTAACLLVSEAAMSVPEQPDEEGLLTARPDSDRDEDVLLRVSELERTFRVKGSRLGRRSGRFIVNAVAGVSLDVHPAEIVGLVGESGSGKSTLGRIMAGFDVPTAGAVYFRGHSMLEAPPEVRRQRRREVQMIYQNPYASLNPRMRIGAAIAEPLRVHHLCEPEQVQARVTELLQTVELSPALAQSLPTQLSGGQRQRVAIARALAMNPRVVIADEAVSSLDVSVQAQILNLILELRSKLRVSWLFIGHNLGTVHYVADRIAVMYGGEIVEEGSASKVFETPQHPYTQELLSGIPDLKNTERAVHPPPAVRADRELPASGCRYAPRCRDATSLCTGTRPVLEQVGISAVACWKVTDHGAWSAAGAAAGPDIDLAEGVNEPTA
jgi:peptide/nickel transport system ATP-binding protein